MASTPPASPDPRELCARAAFDSALAVRTQLNRIREIDRHDAFENSRRIADAQFLVIALWRLRMAAEMAKSLSADPARIGEALDAYDRALPHIRSLRHVLMHFDSYGLENDARRNTFPDSERLYGANDVEGLWASPDHVAWLGVAYEFEATDRAAVDLFAAVSKDLGQPGWS